MHHLLVLLVVYTSVLKALASKYVIVGPFYNDFMLAKDSLVQSGVIALSEKNPAIKSFEWMKDKEEYVLERYNVKWIADPDTTVIVMGNVLGKRSGTKKMMSFMTSVTSQAFIKKGKLVFVMGPFELMNILGDQKYISADDYQDFGGQRHRELEFMPIGGYGSTIRHQYKPFFNSNDGIVFAHGLISRDFINSKGENVQNELRSLDSSRKVKSGSIFGKDGPIMRGFDFENEEEECQTVRETLNMANADLMVVSIRSPDGKVTMKCDGKLLLTDVVPMQTKNPLVSVSRDKVDIATVTIDTSLDEIIIKYKSEAKENEVINYTSDSDYGEEDKGKSAVGMDDDDPFMQALNSLFDRAKTYNEELKKNPTYVTVKSEQPKPLEVKQHPKVEINAPPVIQRQPVKPKPQTTMDDFDPNIIHSGANTYSAVRTTDQVKDIPIYAIGDIHGDRDKLLDLLNYLKLTDPKYHRWIGGKSILVQTGDIVDRGPYAKQIWKYLHGLRAEARLAGGDIVLLLGNHETSNLLHGHTGEVSQADINEWGGHFQRKYSFINDGSNYRQFLLSLDTSAQLGETVFVHGGILPEYAAEGIDNINADVRKGLINFEKTNKIFLDDGPLWTRAFSGPNESEDILCPILETSLKLLNAKRMVVGHTGQADGMIKTRCGGKLVMIDVYLSDYIVWRGRLSRDEHFAALRILNGAAEIIYRDEIVPINDDDGENPWQTKNSYETILKRLNEVEFAGLV